MNELSSIGLDALLEAAKRWGAFALLFVPTLAISIAALVLRVRIAARSARRFGADGSGQWLDQRRCMHGRVSLAQPRKKQCVARFQARKKQGHPHAVALIEEARVRLADGVEVRIPASTTVHFELGTRSKIAESKIVNRQGSGNDELQTVEIFAKDGAEVWLVAHLTVPVADGALRSSASIELTSTEGIELHFERPEPPETRFLATFTALWLALTSQVFFAFAEGWRTLLLLSQALFVLFAIRSIQNTRAFLRALDDAP